MEINKAISAGCFNIFPEAFTRPTTHFIRQHIKYGGLTGFEIGTADGCNALTILKTLPIEKLYLIDPYVDYEEKGRTVCLTNEFENAKRRLKKYSDKIEFILEPSDEAADKIPDKSCDFGYIDGCHDYEVVKKDIELYFPKIVAGGVLGGHDFCANYPDVPRAVLEFASAKKKPLGGKDIDWWIINLGD